MVAVFWLGCAATSAALTRNCVTRSRSARVGWEKQALHLFVFEPRTCGCEPESSSRKEGRQGAGRSVFDVFEGVGKRCFEMGLLVRSAGTLNGKENRWRRKLRRGLFYLSWRRSSLWRSSESGLSGSGPAGLSAWAGPPSGRRPPCHLARPLQFHAVRRGGDRRSGGRLCAPRSRGLVNPDAGVLIRWP